MNRFIFVAASLAAFCARADKPLPSVDSVLTKATSKARDFAQQATAMQQKLQEQQEQSRVLLQTQKQEYELRLQVQHNQSQVIELQNAELRSGNDKLQKMNANMSADLKVLTTKNAELRSTIVQVSEKVSAAQLFLADSLKVTDDSKAQELEVLIPATPKPTLDHFLAVTSGKVSLLAVSSSSRREPEEFIQGLSASLGEISTAAKEAAVELKARFLETFDKEQARQVELNATQTALLQSQTSLQEHRAKLLEAKAHLEATHKELVQRLRAVRTFAGKVNESVVSSLRAEVAVAGNVAVKTHASVVTNASVKTNASVAPNASVTTNVSVKLLQKVPPAAVSATRVASLATAAKSASFLKPASKADGHTLTLSAKPGLVAVADPLDDLKHWFDSKAPSQENLKVWYAAKDELKQWFADKLR